MTDETEQVTAVPSPGEMLAAARKSAGLTTKQIAERLNLKEQVIKAIEADAFEQLPNSTFVKGYLKNYAKLVQVSCQDVLHRYGEIAGAPVTNVNMQSFSKRTARERTNSRIMWLTYLIILILIGFVILWWWQKTQREDKLLELVQ